MQYIGNRRKHEPGPEYPVEDAEIAPEKHSHVCETIAT